MMERLSGFAIARQAYGLVWRYRLSLALLAWPFVVGAIVSACLRSYQRDLAGHPDTGIGLLILIVAITWAVFSIPVATSAYRVFIAGPRQRLGISFKVEEKLFFWASLRLAGRVLLIALPALVVTTFAAGSVMKMILAASRLFHVSLWPTMIFGAVVMVVIWGLVAFISLRYFLVLPAAALGRRVKLADSARVMRGNVARLWGAHALIVLPILILQVLVLIVAGKLIITFALSKGLAAVAVSILAVPGQIFGLFLPIAAVSALYSELARTKAAGG